MPTLLFVHADEQRARLLARHLELTISGLRVAYASSRTAALEVGRQLQPDVLLVDRTLPDSDGVDLIWDLRTLAPDVHAVVLGPPAGRTDAPDDRNSDGPVTYLAGPQQLDEIADCVTAVLRLADRRRFPRPVPGTGNHHEVANRLSALMVGLQAFGSDLRACAQDGVSVNDTVDEYLDRLLSTVRHLATLLRGQEGLTR